MREGREGGVSRLAIAEYALLSDCRSAALVSRGGSVAWLCFPRFDGPSVFARLLDDDAGHFWIRPVGDVTVTRRYLDQTMALETTFRTLTGAVVLVDAMALGPDEHGHHLGANSPGALLRRLDCTDGHITVEVSYAPRPEYGLIHPLLAAVDGAVVSRGGADVLALSAPTPLQIDGSTATTRLSLRAGATTAFALHHAKRWEPPPRVWSQEEIAERLDDTIRAWRSWSQLHQSYEGPWRDLVHHSGRVLQALTFEPTGAIVAAPTTSLPEAVGAERNWDYRYTWVRDASLTMEALWVAACPDEAHCFFDFLAGAAPTQLRRGQDLQIMFGVGGEHDLTERVLTHLGGWRDSRPVRVGNGAWTQRQLDVYGELLGAAERLVDQLGELDPATANFLVEAADAAAARWKDKDQGIWELRGAPRDFLYSKLMCWVALDRAIGLAGLLHATYRVADWTASRQQIRAAILEQGWSEEAGAFTQAFGSHDLDASSLMLAITGFLAGEVDQARATFETAIAFANDVGLLAEEVDPASGELLGNFPQAFSHIGLINAAWAIAHAERHGQSDAPAADPGALRRGSERR